jgi:hypothetical protein
VQKRDRLTLAGVVIRKLGVGESQGRHG